MKFAHLGADLVLSREICRRVLKFFVGSVFVEQRDVVDDE